MSAISAELFVIISFRQSICYRTDQGSQIPPDVPQVIDCLVIHVDSLYANTILQMIIHISFPMFLCLHKLSFYSIC